MQDRIATMQDVYDAEIVINQHLSPAPLVRSYRLEQELKLSNSRRVWFKDYGWTPVGSFKLLGALNWMAHHAQEVGDCPVVAHSSGNFASGISFAGMRYGKRVIVLMPDTAPQVKFELTRSFGAEVRTYNIARDHETGERDRIAKEIAEGERAVQASPYNDLHVIAGNGVGGVQIARDLQQMGREISHFLCQVSGGGIMAGHALAISDLCPNAQIIGVEPTDADDFCQSLRAGKRVRLERPKSICDGLLSYDVGEQNWPILQRCVTQGIAVPDRSTCEAMRWLYTNHGLRTEPSGAIATAAVLNGLVDLSGTGDVVITISGRNVDEAKFQEWIGQT